MKDGQSLLLLRARVKLFKRHVREWNTLLSYQRQVRFLSDECSSLPTESVADERLMLTHQRTNQKMRLSRLCRYQTQERQHMRDRHQQEVIDLDQLMLTHDQMTLYQHTF